LENFKGFDTSYAYDMASQISSDLNRQQREAMELVQRAHRDKEAYQNEMLRSLHAIESNTATLHTIVDLIGKSNEQQDELISIITEILSIAKAKDKIEAKSLYEKTVGRMASVIKDGEALAKLMPVVTAVYNAVTSAFGNQSNMTH
jgi:GTP1/Obg family GTP-binding protein